MLAENLGLLAEGMENIFATEEHSPVETSNTKSSSGRLHFKKHVFRYTAKIGHFPKEAESYVFVRRTDPITKVTKVIPEMAYPIQANKLTVPKHELLEDDWRAFRSVFHNYQSLMRSYMDPAMEDLEHRKCMDVAKRICGIHIKVHRKSLRSNYIRTLDMYKDSVDAPLGYMYRRYKLGSVTNQEDLEMKPGGKVWLRIPILVFEGPLMDVVHIRQGEQVKAEWDKEMEYYDADIVVGGPSKGQLYIYNEPDAIPLACAKADFSISLTERALKAATCNISQSGAANNNNNNNNNNVNSYPTATNIFPHANFPIPELLPVTHTKVVHSFGAAVPLVTIYL